MEMTVAMMVAMAAILAVITWRQREALGVIKLILLAIIRVVGVVVITGILLRPVREVPVEVQTEKPVFSILIDSSASMAVADQSSTSRWAAVMKMLQAESITTFPALGSFCELQGYDFDESTRSVRFARLMELAVPTGQHTDMISALQYVHRSTHGRERAGMLLISDGRNLAAGDLKSTLSRLRAEQHPVWTVTVGSTADQPDVSVRARLDQSYIFATQPAVLKVMVTQAGFDLHHTTVHLYREGVSMAQRPLVFHAGLAEVEFPITEDRKGVVKYRVDVDPLPGEYDVKNNSRTLFVRVVDKNIRILVLEGEPYWDSKFMLRVLQEDPNLDVISLFYLTKDKVFAIEDQLREHDLQGQRRAGVVNVPQTKDEWGEYDCLVLGKGLTRLLSAAQLRSLRDYVADGGGSVVFFRGQSDASGHESLAGLEPVIWDQDWVDSVPLELTRDGKASPVFSFANQQPADVILRTLPTMLGVSRVKGERSLAVVLAVSQDPANPAQPLTAVAYQRYGHGKVMTIAATGLWRWALLPQHLRLYSTVYHELWRHIIRWMVMDSDFFPGQDIQFKLDRYTYQPGEAVVMTVRTRFVDENEYHPRIDITHEDGTVKSVQPARIDGEPGVWRAVLPLQEEGEYQAVLHNNIGQPDEETVRFTVYQDSLESRMVSADPETMATIASGTGGEVLTLENISNLPDRVQTFRKSRRLEPVMMDAWDRESFFFMLIAWLSMEWLLRKKWGMV
jgi:uncharacterized membrane protein